jgi:hypothetical protein
VAGASSGRLPRFGRNDTIRVHEDGWQFSVPSCQYDKPPPAYRPFRIALLPVRILLSRAETLGRRAGERRDQALAVGVPTPSFLATKPPWPPEARRARTANQEEKRRFKGRVAATALPRRLLANFPPSGTMRDVVRGRKDQRTAHKRTPPAGYLKSPPSIETVRFRLWPVSSSFRP